jgi:hypothetical protein
MTMNSYFCDGLKEVTILNGVARLEFHRLQPATPGGSAAADVEPVSEMIVALPVQGLLQALSVLEQVRARLVQEAAAQPEPKRTRSPNFA